MKEGRNPYREITRVFDPEEGGVTFPPRFRAVFTGVENKEGTREVHTVLLDGKGNAWATGANDSGQLCLGDDIDRLIPERIELDARIVDVAVGGAHTLLLDKDGNVFGCGSNTMGQLGLGRKPTSVDIPTRVDLGRNSIEIATVSAGHSHTLMSSSDGDLYVTGSNEYGQLCADTDGKDVFTPRAFDVDDREFAAFEAGRHSSYVLHVDGSANACGSNDRGQLGDGTNDDAFVTAVKLPKDRKIFTSLGVGPAALSAFFLTEDGRAWGTGANDRGQLGVGNKRDRDRLTMLEFQEGTEVHLLSAGETHSLALKTGGDDPTAYPTFAPSEVGDSSAPTYSPSSGYPTFSPTETPGTESPTPMGSEFWFWGAPEAVGQDNDGENVLEPVSTGPGVAHVSAG